MEIVQTLTFERTIKKLHPNQKEDLDKALRQLLTDPCIGMSKKGDLAGILVYKFRLINQVTLLAYIYDKAEQKLILLALASHENFYRDLKK